MATPFMNLVLPIPNVTSGTWGNMLNAAIDLVDAHDHTTGKGPQVPMAGLAAAGTPGPTTFLRGDGSWATISGSGLPGTPSASIQFNDGGAFGGSSYLVFDKNTGSVVSTGNASAIDIIATNAHVSFPFVRIPSKPTLYESGIGILETTTSGYCANLRLTGRDGDETTQNFGSLLVSTSWDRNSIEFFHHTFSPNDTMVQYTVKSEGHPGRVDVSGKADNTGWMEQILPVHLTGFATSPFPGLAASAFYWPSDPLNAVRDTMVVSADTENWGTRLDASDARGSLKLGMRDVGTFFGTDPGSWTFYDFGTIKWSLDTYTSPASYKSAVRITASGSGQVGVQDTGSYLAGASANVTAADSKVTSTAGTLHLVLDSTNSTLKLFDGVTEKADLRAYDLFFSSMGSPTANQVLARIIAVRAFTIPVNAASSLGSVGTNPTSSATLLLKKNGATAVTITISTGGAFTFTNASPVTVAASDILTLVAQASPDATLADIALTMVGFL